MLRRVGALSLVILLIAPLTAGAIVFFALPALAAPVHEASARVNVSEVTGSVSSFDVATQAADFTVEYYSQVALVTGEDQVRPMLDTSRAGESGFVDVVFVAESADAAEQGLRTAVGNALSNLVDQRIRVAESEVRGAEATYESMTSRANQFLEEADGDENDAGSTGASALLNQSATQLVMAEVRLRSATSMSQQLPQIVEELDVTVTELSDLEQRIRVAGVAALSAVALVLPLLIWWYRRSAAASSTPGSHRGVGTSPS